MILGSVQSRIRMRDTRASAYFRGYCNMRAASAVVALLLSSAQPTHAGCASWCNEFTCNNEDGRCPDCIALCGSCQVCLGPPMPPPDPEPTPPDPPAPPVVPLTSVGHRPAEYWTQGSHILTNTFGDGKPHRLIIKGASWSGMESQPCYFHGLPLLHRIPPRTRSLLARHGPCHAERTHTL
jgi:hypothetical protein